MTDLAYRTRDFVSYRTRNILVATGLAVLAVVLTMVYVSHARKSTTTAGGGPVQVMVAARDIPIGTAGSALVGSRWVVAKRFDRADVPAGAVTSLAQLATLVAIQPTYAGEQLVARRFGTTQQEGLLGVLHGTYRVVQLAGDENQLLAGTIKVGNHVDVVGSVRVSENGQQHQSATFLRDLLVVSTPSKPSGTTTDTSIELRVTSQQAQRLFWLAKNADWTLLLRPATKATDQSSTPTNATNLFGATNGR